MTSFIAFAAANGVIIDANRFDTSGRIRRCGTEDKPRSTNGAYKFDGARGWVFRWDAEAKPIFFESGATVWTEEEKQAWRIRKRKAEKLMIQRKEYAVYTAQQLKNSAIEAEHNYFHYKGLKDQKGHVLPDGELLIPMYSVSARPRKIQGAQVIKWDEVNRTYSKKYIVGMQAADAVFFVGSDRAKETILCEGYATGLSIAAACRLYRFNALVVVCFSSGNLLRASKHFPRAIVYADNDVSKTGEKVAVETGLRWCMSGHVGHDANDDHQKQGLSYVADKIWAAMRS